MGQIRRRQFLTAVGTLLAMPLAFAQQARRPYRVGWPQIASRHATRSQIASLERGLRELGYVIERDVVVDVRTADGRIDRIAEIVGQTVESKPDVIVTVINPVTMLAKAATQAIPIVMVVGTDVIRSGLVQSLARPGGNVTGLTWDVGGEIQGKRIELLKGLQPEISRMAVLWEPPFRDQFQVDQDNAASALGVKSRWFEWSGDIRGDLGEIVKWRADALFVHAGARAHQNRIELNKLATQHGLPTAHGVSEQVKAGGLMSYGPNLPDLFRRAAGYVDKILKGARPADLPVEQPRRIDFVINLSTAKILGISVPQMMLLRADRIIE